MVYTKGMNLSQIIKQLLTRPIYSVELFFVGAPFFFAQVLVFGIAYIAYRLATGTGMGTYRLNSETISQYFDINIWFLLAPIAAAIGIKLVSLLLQRNIILTWRHWFWSFTAIDTLLYGVAFIYMAGQGLFHANNGLIGVGLVVGLYTLTITFTFLHFYLIEKINRL